MRNLLLGLFFLLGCAVHAPQPPTTVQAAQRLLDTTVLVRATGSFGAGFPISPSRIMTAAHVVLGEPKLTVHTRDGKKCEVKSVRAFVPIDLAVLEVRGCHFLRWIGTAVEPVPGMEVLAAGHPNGFKWSVTHGIVSATNRGLMQTMRIQLDAAVNGGMSGGPIVDRYGRLVGVVVSIYSVDGMFAGISFAVPGPAALQLAGQPQ